MSLLFVLAGANLPLLLGLGLGLSALLVGLYLLREQHRPLVVPFVDLWRRALEKKTSSVPWQRLRRLLSLLLQLLLLGLLLLALADPQPDAASNDSRTVVFLVDVSPSMAAQYDAKTGRTRLDEAKGRLVRWIRTLGARDRAVIVSLSARPRVESGFTGDQAVLEPVALSLAVQHSAADVPRGLELAREIVPRKTSAEVILIGDGAYPALTSGDTRDVQLSFEPITGAPSSEQDNVGISNFSARRYPDDPRKFEAQLELSSTAKASVEVEVVLSAVREDFRQEVPIEVRRALLPVDGRLVIPLTDLSGVTEGVIAEVHRVDGGPDWLPTDNRAYLLLMPLPPLRVLTVGEPNQFLDAALLTEPDVVTNRRGHLPSSAGARHDVVIYDGSVSSSGVASSNATLHLGPPPEGEPYPVRVGRRLRNFGFDRWKKDSPVFTAVDPYDVQVLEGHALIPGPNDTPLAFSGSEPIMIMGERAEGRFIALGFDPRQSDFYLRAAWPLFVHNVIWELAPRVSGEDGIALSPGREWHLRTPTSSPIADVSGPLGQSATKDPRSAVTEQRMTVFGELAGFYEIEQDGKRLRFFANYFDDAEARLAARSALDVLGAPDSKRALPRPRPFERKPDFAPWLVLIGVVLLLSFSEWWSYHARWTV